MLKRFSVDFILFSMALDAVLIAISLAGAVSLRPELNTLPFVAYLPGPVQVPLPLYFVFPTLWIFVLQLLSVYDGRRTLRLRKELARLTVGSILATIALAGLLYLSYRDISRMLFLTFAFSAYLLLVLWRTTYRVAFRWGIFQATPPRRVLVVGAGTLGRQVADQIFSYKGIGLEVIGFVDDDPLKLDAYKDVLGPLADTYRLVANQKIDDVIIALPMRAFTEINRLVAELHNLPVKVWVIPDYFHLALHKAVVEEYAGIPMLDLRAPALNDYQRLVKRIFDLVVMICSLPFTLPVMALAAMAIKLDDHGPVLFRQQRVGENGKLFEMLKFRTMVPNAEELRHLVEHVDENGNFIHKAIDDPRVTRVGKFLRRTSIDEFPQTFNILRGDMSLVGPRPELPYLVEKYEAWQRKRFAVPQGLTGWWQINGRSDRPMHLHTEDDLYYVQNYSFLLDMQILLKTVGSVLRRKGAF